MFCDLRRALTMPRILPDLYRHPSMPPLPSARPHPRPWLASVARCACSVRQPTALWRQSLHHSITTGPCTVPHDHSQTSLARRCSSRYHSGSGVAGCSLRARASSWSRLRRSLSISRLARTASEFHHSDTKPCCSHSGSQFFAPVNSEPILSSPQTQVTRHSSSQDCIPRPSRLPQ